MRIFKTLPGPAIAAVVLLGVLLAGCEEYLEEPPFELEEARLIITSNFAPHEKVTVSLTASEPIAGPVRTGQIDNADVSIYRGDELIETLEYLEQERGKPGVYCSRDFHPETGVPYTLKASAPGFTPVHASSAIPTSTEITRLEVSDLNVSRVHSELLVYDFNLLLDYNDPSFAENFYDIRIKQLVYPFHIVSGTGDTVLLDPVFKTVESLAEVTEENTLAGESSYLIADKPMGGIIVGLISKFDPKTEILGDLVVELRTVSRDYYNFQVGIQQERRIYNRYDEPAVTSLYSNVGGGYGVFAGFNRVTKTFSLVD